MKIGLLLNIPVYKTLAPDKNLLISYKRDSITPEEYTKTFRKYLDGLDPKEVFNELIETTNGIEPVLMCYCNKDKFCHRHLVAEWLEKELDISIQEYSIADTKTVRKDGYIINGENNGG